MLRNAILALTVIVVVNGLVLPEPVKGPTKFGNLAESLKINAGLSVQHLPNSDKIVSVWVEEGSNLQLATTKGAIMSTTGEINGTFTVSASNVLSFYTPAVIIPRTSSSFSVITASYSAGSLYAIRDFDTSGQLLAGPYPIRNSRICIYSHGVVHESSGDIFFVCTFSAVNSNNVTEYFLNAHRINSTGDILDSAIYQTDFENSKPTIAVSGNTVAISTVVLDLANSIAVLQVFRADADNLANADTFLPYAGFSLTLAHHVVADPLNENAFVLFACTGLIENSNLFAYIVGIRFDRENTSIAETYVSYTDLAISLSVSVSEQGQGVVYLVTSTPVSVVYPIQLANSSTTVFELDTAEFNSIRTFSDAEQSVEAWKDLRSASTTWSTGSAVVWYEVSEETSTFSVLSKIFGTYCGDNFAEGDEECDGGANCSAECTCPVGESPDGKNGCGSSNPVSSSPSASPSSQPTRPISVGPVATPSEETSTAHSTASLTFVALLVITMASAF